MVPKDYRNPSPEASHQQNEANAVETETATERTISTLWRFPSGFNQKRKRQKVTESGGTASHFFSPFVKSPGALILGEDIQTDIYLFDILLVVISLESFIQVAYSEVA